MNVYAFDKKGIQTAFVHFDYTKNADTVILGVAIYKSEFEQMPIVDRTVVLDSLGNEHCNNFHYSVKAMRVAFELLRDNVDSLGIKTVKLYNQNGLVFEWLTGKEPGYAYASDLNDMFVVLADIVNKVDIEYSVIDGKNNKVKKLLKTKSSSVKPTAKKADLSFLKDMVATTRPTEKETSNVTYLKELTL